MNPRRPLSHGGTGSIPEVGHAGNADVQMPGGSGRREDTATQNVVTEQGGSRQSYEETMSVQVTTEVNVPGGGRNGKLQIDKGSSPFIPNEQSNRNERTFTHQTPTRHQVTGDNSYHRAEGDDGNAGLEKASPVSITGHYSAPVGDGDAGGRASGDEVLGKTSEKTDDVFRDPPSEDYEFEINLRETAGDRRFDRVFGGSFLPADTIFRAAVRGESPHYVFERGSSSITSPENPSIQRGLVRHVGSFTSTQHQGKVNVRIYGAQGR
ncbi:uncharacterized protein LOC135202222 [Macrobrachium nipponense]|uniref:uncharacterized protein LOC135202222 n=1 Tax=Macrobrachium nipponense TaxID=159736 RepID=UPI0030C7DE6B